MAAASLPFWLQSCDFLSARNFPIHVQTDHRTGHLMMQSQHWQQKKRGHVQTVVVGGGVAGLSAAISLQHQDFMLFELSDRIGGTSGAARYGNMYLSQGAHYDLAYPHNYGEEVLQLLERLAIIQYEPWKKMWSFQDRQHIIPFARRQQCYEKGSMRKEVLRDGYLKQQFDALMSRYDNEMPLPTRLIDEKHRHLNELTFYDFLMQHLPVNDDFIRQVNYHMMDDWGGTSHQVSALAGVHYFSCRPYLKASVDLFSPPEGNHYFIQKMAEQLPGEQLKCGHLVSRVMKTGSGFEVEVVDTEMEQIHLFTSDEVVYAGQKHALKYTYPSEYHLFSKQIQAPWMVLNFVCKERKDKYGYWQNEFLGENAAFLGFIDSGVQDRPVQQGNRVLTAYYCLKPEDRNYLTTIPEHKSKIVAETLAYIEEMLNEKLQVASCFIHVMGHAMSIPAKGFLFNDANDKKTDLRYAGVDNGRLPLLFEAMDSGVVAAGLCG